MGHPDDRDRFVRFVESLRAKFAAAPDIHVLSHSIESFSQRTESFGLLSQRT